MPPPYGLLVEFLALTGQRREEVAQLKWDELDEKTRTWTIPGTRTKNKKVHIVHLSTPAWKVIEACSGEPYVFGTARGKRFQRFGREKHAIDKLCGITGWRLHDLRRTIVSGMARLGIPPHVAGKILNHQAGTISGVAAVYQRHDFLAERKEALDRWGRHVGEIVQAEVRAAELFISGSKVESLCAHHSKLLESQDKSTVDLSASSPWMHLDRLPSKEKLGLVEAALRAPSSSYRIGTRSTK